jgi:hypothetical protein
MLATILGAMGTSLPFRNSGAVSLVTSSHSVAALNMTPISSCSRRSLVLDTALNFRSPHCQSHGWQICSTHASQRYHSPLRVLGTDRTSRLLWASRGFAPLLNQHAIQTFVRPAVMTDGHSQDDVVLREGGIAEMPKLV